MESADLLIRSDTSIQRFLTKVPLEKVYAHRFKHLITDRWIKHLEEFRVQYLAQGNEDDLLCLPSHSCESVLCV